MSLPLSYLNISGVGEVDKRYVIAAVRIGSEGEIDGFSVEKYTPITILSTDPIFRDDLAFSAVSELSRYIGLPLVARRAPPLHDGLHGLDPSNYEAASLFRSCDVPAFSSSTDDFGLLRPGFGQIPDRWLSPGPIIVARLDRKPLHPLHAAAVVAFCTRCLDPGFQESEESERVWRHRLASIEYVYEQRRRALSNANGVRFAKFFELYKRRRILGEAALKSEWSESFDDLRRIGRWSVPADETDPRPDWANVPMPFDV